MHSDFLLSTVVLTLSLIFLEGINVVTGEGVIFNFRELFTDSWKNLYLRLKGTFELFLDEDLEKKYGGKSK
ncbi:unnamed protein product [Schistosoma rodhaini]|uniref:Uncharacterized protein n=1 Tax=Schistosoma rodhaini TaxID=6188 RepID=A0AA85GDL9_9TREM|nr:unnamed protein product [Schistosoma rodhaini]CAH8637879.1 unnamed protein product [Schistosoma rodhaini]